MPRSTVRFGNFELDSARYQLRRDGRLLKLERIPMELLMLLVERHGELVTREVIVERLWGKDVFLETEHSINTAINKLRRVLRDDPGNPRYIQTIFGKGYRFLIETNVLPEIEASPASVPKPPPNPLQVGDLSLPETAPIQPDGASPLKSLVPDESASSLTAPFLTDRPPRQKATLDSLGITTIQPNIPATRVRKPRRILWALAGLFALAATLYPLARLTKKWSAQARPGSDRDIHSIAVLPLANLSNDPEQEYLVDGMTDQLITDLARTTSLRVISRTSAMQYKQAHKALPEIARELNVDAVVEGSVLPTQGNVRITAQLLDARTDRHLWAQSYERSAKDLLAMQDDVAQDIAHQIATTLHPAARNLGEHAVNPEAYDKYLRGRYFWNRRTLADLEKSISYYNQAIELAPDFAPAYAALGDVYAVITYRGGPPPTETYPRARDAAEKALQLDTTLADAHALLGEVMVNYDFDWKGGETEFRRAIELNPNYPTAHHWYAILLALQGKSDEAQIEIEKAYALDPLSMVIDTTRAELRYWAGEFDGATEMLRQAEELDPSFAELYSNLGRVYEQKKQYPEATQSFKRAVDLSGGNPKMLMLQAHADALSGKKDRAAATVRRVLSAKHGYVANSDVAAVYCAMGEPAVAVEWLNKGYEGHEEGMTLLAVEPLFDGCRHDPPFQTLLERLKFPSPASK
jgi:TolB-like protein/DNA-binding winged helix-turn-helix (wHTH) protein/Flp pilus assembly protein TadD